MGKLLIVTVTLLLISNQLQNGIAFDVLGTASSLIGMCQFFVDVIKTLAPEKTPINDVLIEVKRLSKTVVDRTETILESITDLRDAVRFASKEEALQDHFDSITAVFEETLEKKAKILQGRIYRNSSDYRTFAHKGNKIDESINKIRLVFSNPNVTNVLSQNFLSNLNTYEDTCRTGMSELQLLDTLLGNIKFIHAQYFWAKKYMYDFLELLGENNTEPKEDLLTDVIERYSKIAQSYKDFMTNKSTELGKCDPRNRFNDSIRFIHVEDPNYSEIRAFSKYILNENSFSSYERASCNDNRCPTIRKAQHCHDELCKRTSPCPGSLIGCEQFTDPFTDFDVCINDNSQTHYRYRSITPTNSQEPFPCDAKYKDTLYTIQYGGIRGYAARYCHQCQCICENSFEQNKFKHGYFIDGLPVRSIYSWSRVVTGARLVVEDFKNDVAEGKILRIQIEEAQLGYNGTIMEKKWVPLTSTKNYTEADLKMIRWHEHRRFYLSPVKLPENELVIGLQFIATKEKHIMLAVISNKVEYRTGRLHRWQMQRHVNSIPLKNSYDVSNTDVPTQARLKNQKLSYDNQYVEFSVTNLERDGGQTTVPFIDSQKLSANMPLTGASLYVKGQSGYGGFLGIKLYTFNTQKYVNTEKNINANEAEWSLLIENFTKQKKVKHSKIPLFETMQV